MNPGGSRGRNYRTGPNHDSWKFPIEYPGEVIEIEIRGPVRSNANDGAKGKPVHIRRIVAVTRATRPNSVARD